MRNAPLFATLLSLLGAAAPAAPGDTIADRVLGQKGFRSSNPYFLTGKVFVPADIAVGGPGGDQVWIADRVHDRVLGWRHEADLLAGRAADVVLGQPDANTGSRAIPTRSGHRCASLPSASDLCSPESVAVGGDGRVFVADRGNRRILVFERPFETDTRADAALGQENLDSALPSTTPFSNEFAHVAHDPASGAVWTIILSLDGAGSYDPTSVQRFDSPFVTGESPSATISSLPAALCQTDDPGGLCRALDLDVDDAGTLHVLSRALGSTQLVERRTDGSTEIDRRNLEPFGPEATRLALDPQSARVVVSNGARFEVRGTGAGGAGGSGEWSDLPIQRGTVWRSLVHGQAGGAVAFGSEGSLLVAGATDPDHFLMPGVERFAAPTFAGPPLAVRSPLPPRRGLSLPQALAIDRGSSPPHLYATDRTPGTAPRLLAWRDAADFDSGAPADWVETLDTRCVGPPICGAMGLAVDRAGNLFVSETGMDRVLAFRRPFETDRIPDRTLGRSGREDHQLHGPGALAVTSDGTLFVADLANDRVVGFRDPLGAGEADILLGARRWSCNGDPRGCVGAGFRFSIWDQVHQGVPPDEFMEGNAGLAVDDSGALFVADHFHDRVMIYLPATDGEYRLHHRIGRSSVGPTASSLSRPTGLAVDGQGRLWVADSGNDRLLRFGSSHAPAADLVIGHPGFRRGRPGAPRLPSAANLLSPQGLGIDPEGSLFVADQENHRILVYQEPGPSLQDR